MISRTGILLTLAAVALLLLPTSCADATSSYNEYASQLDENGKAVYDSLSVFESSQSPVLDLRAGFPRVVLYATEEEAKDAAVRTVNDALAAKYLSDPYGIWLWNLPTKSVEVKPDITAVKIEGDQKTYCTVVSASFSLSVPEKYQDKVPEVLEAVKDAAKTFGGSDSDKAKAIAKHLSGITKEDEEGAVSDIYDALVKRSSSSFGIAAAYTYLAAQNGLEAITAKGAFYGSSDKGSACCWNLVHTEGAWYAVDASKGHIMVGSSTSVGSTPFISAYSPDLDMKDPNDLDAPDLNRTAYPYPDETPFLEKHGAFILVALMVAIVVASLFYGARKGYA
ncbi:MAG: hypothetical protein IKQ60_04925 [Candidatus Methanomethylophilaceae archaeon]|nr:hypothetical protein [Candidatus Methanomethylophilaceae archaeon]